MLVVQHDNGLHNTAIELLFSISFSSFRRYSHFLDLGYGFPHPPSGFGLSIFPAGGGPGFGVGGFGLSIFPAGGGPGSGVGGFGLSISPAGGGRPARVGDLDCTP